MKRARTLLARVVVTTLLAATSLAWFTCAAAAESDANAPNLTIYAYQRIFAPDTAAVVSLSTYNLRKVTLSVYRTEIEALIPNAAILDAPDDRRNPNSVLGRLTQMKLGVPVKTWTVRVKDYYPDEWVDREAKLPKLASGVYVLEARGGGVTSRTWLAVSKHALVVKRSPDVVKAWLVTSGTGQPVEAGKLALYDAKGRAQVAQTARDGTATFAVPAAAPSGAGAAPGGGAAAGSGTAGVPLWVAVQGGEPAFARASAPEAEKPYTVYVYTDRPVYRPGQLVRFRGTIRAVHRGAYSLPPDQTVQVQIKAREDTIVYDEKLPVNEWGTFSGDFQLAPEPPLGTYSLEVVLPKYREYGSFEVAAYRKPEFDVAVAVPEPYVLGGTTVPVTISADYYFGSPVAGARVNYTVRFEQVSDIVPKRILNAAGLGSAAVGQIEDDFEGQGRLNTQGKLELAVPTRSLPFDREMTVEAEVTDLAQRPRSAEATTLVTAARFRLWLSPKEEQYQPGQSVEILVDASGYDDEPVETAVTVTMIERLTDREGRTYEEKTQRVVTTDKYGRAVAAFKVLRPGEYGVEAWARDTEGNVAFAETSFYVSKEKPEFVWPELETWLDRSSYAPGETALLHVRTSMVGAWAMLTVEGERLYRCEVRRFLTNEFDIKLPVLREYEPGVHARLTIVRRGDLYTTGDPLNVPAADKKLVVVVTPDKPIYRPGETAVCDVSATDSSGAGVAAEVGIGVVDAALYAIAPDETPDPVDVFWGSQADRVVVDFSHAATYPGGGMQRVPEKAMMMEMVGKGAADGGKDGEEVRIRRLFVDTACWAASVVTGKDGHARVTFTVPDNLTTWRITARGLSKETQAGQVRQEVKVTLPLLVRLTLPRFYVRNDDATATAIVHNYTGAEKEVRVTLAAEGAEVGGAAGPTVTLTVPADGIQRVTWPVKVTGMASAGPSDQARFLVVADGGPGARDAVENTVPVLPDGVRRVDATAGMTGESAAIEMTVPEIAEPGTASLEVTLSPSLAGPIFDALDYLVRYPHGCAEQTMDRFLPNIIVTRTLQELGVKRPEPPMLKRYVSFGVQKLLRYQHDDGGWHWWEFDESDPYITAYVVYGLAMARDAGYSIAAGPLPRGVDYLRQALREEPERTAACYLLWALASVNRWDDVEAWRTATTVARRLVAERAKLDTFSRASLAMALDRLSRRQPKTLADLAAAAITIAGELEGVAVASGTAAHWTANSRGDGSWLDSDVEVTAQVLQALLVLKPDSARTVPAVRWLMAARQGKSWNSTKDTAAAVLALTAYLKRAQELSPDETVTVSVRQDSQSSQGGQSGQGGQGGQGGQSGGQPVQTVRFTQEQVFSDAVRVTIPAAALKPGTNVVRLEKTGSGNIYWSANLSYVVPAAQAEPLARGIEVKRQYRVVAEDPVTAGQQPSGSMIEVITSVVSSQNYRYAMLEEPIPAGCEIVQGDEDEEYDEWYDRREVWDDRIVYYFDYLPKGEMTLTYWLRAEAPGTYRVRPGCASLMYFPEVRGEGKPVRLLVVREAEE